MTKPRILVVEDEAITGDHLRRILNRFGYDVVAVAANAAAGLEHLEQTTPDLLLADIGLAGAIDGVELGARAREEWGIPTIFLTAYGDPETMMRARISEPYEYLLKPFAEQELHASIEIALRHKFGPDGQDQKTNITAQILARTEEQLRAAAERLFRTQEEERKTIASALHDDLGQGLALLKIELEALWTKIPAEIQQWHQREFEEAFYHTGDLLQTLRTISDRLHPSILVDLGLVVALSRLAAAVQEQHALPTRFSARNVPDHLHPDIALRLYRITQEALRNVVQHAAPAVVNIALIGSADAIRLSVRDSGNGFDPHAPMRRTGLGFLRMAECARAAGGELEIHSRPLQGTRIRVSLPLTPGGSGFGPPS